MNGLYRLCKLLIYCPAKGALLTLAVSELNTNRLSPTAVSEVAYFRT